MCLISQEGVEYQSSYWTRHSHHLEACRIPGVFRIVGGCTRYSDISVLWCRPSDKSVVSLSLVVSVRFPVKSLSEFSVSPKYPPCSVLYIQRDHPEPRLPVKVGVTIFDLGLLKVPTRRVVPYLYLTFIGEYKCFNKVTLLPKVCILW